MIMVPDGSDEADNRSRPRVGDDPFKVSDADLRTKDLGVHDGAREDAVDHADILPHNDEQGARTMMQTWIDAVCAELDLPPDANVDVILDVARVAAHSVERPAAPVTTFLLGMAVAGGMDLKQAAAKIQELAETWPPSAE